MTRPRTSIFLTGATGYIGGSVLAQLLKHPNIASFEITVQTRSPDKAKVFEQFNVKAVVGSNDDTAQLEDLAANAHVVMSCADADNLPAMQAMLRGMQRRHYATGDVPIMIHTSGTGVIATPARGMFASETIYSDLNVDQIKAIPPEALHRNVDLAVINADVKGYAQTYIVAPSTIYGFPTHELVTAGISNPLSVQIPRIARASIARRRAGVVGEGKAIWPDVHIDDTADLYRLLFDAILLNPKGTSHGWEGFYFVDNGEHTWYDISMEIGKALVDLRLSDMAEPTPFTDEELVRTWGTLEFGLLNGSNARCRSDRGRLLGWKPKYTTADLIASIKPTVERIIHMDAGN